MAGAESRVVTGAATTEMREAFGRALAAAMATKGIKAADVANELGVSEDAVRTWMMGTRRVEPLAVFAMERLVGAGPGELSHHLGFLPLEAASSVAAALATDEAVSLPVREALLAAYARLKDG